jgi:hypothetical protein
MESGQIEAILTLLVTQVPALTSILVALGSLVVLGQVVVILTPSKKDELAYAKLMSTPIIGPLLLVASKFSIIQKK